MIDESIKRLLDQATDVVDDSRLIQPGSVFVARAGFRHHGLLALEEAVERGAMAIVHDGLADESEQARLAHLDIPVIRRDTLDTDLPEWLNYFWGHPADGLMLYAVTGTNGKSSIAWMLAQSLNGAMIGTLGIGKPLAHHKSDLTTPSIFSVYRHLAQFRNQGIKHVVIEASSHALVQGRLAGLSFHTTIFTNLGHDHLDYHGDRQAYGDAKRRLFTEFHSENQLINADDEFGEVLIGELHQLNDSDSNILTYSAQPGKSCDLAVTITSGLESASGLDVAIKVASGECFEAHSGLIGSLNAYNLAICAQVMSLMGIEVDQIIQRLCTLSPPPGRMERVNSTPELDHQRGDLPTVIVDYAHTPDALRQALLILRPLCVGQLWCVFGCGGDRDASKRAPMGRLAESLADRVVLTDDNPRHEHSLSIIREIQAGMRHPERARVMTERSEAVAWAIANARSSDLVLLAGKGHETEQIIGDRRLVCDDRALAIEALTHWRSDQQEAC